MKKFLFLMASLFCCATLLTSCESSDKEGTYEFFILEQYNIDSDKALQEIRDIVGKDAYFASRPTYTGKYSQAGTKAINEFLEHADALDAGQICSLIKSPMEHYTLTLWSRDPANRLVSKIFTANKWTNAPENGWTLHQ